MLVSEFARICDALWPPAGADDWDKPGLSVGSLAAEVSGVLLCVDVTEQVIDEALALGVNTVFSHHPLMLKGVSSVSEDTSKGPVVVKAIRAGVSVFSAHTNADIVEDGVSDTIAKRLELHGVRPLVPTAGSAGHGRIGRLTSPQSLGELVNALVAILPETVRGVSASAPGDKLIETVALCGGAGDSFIGAAGKAGADVYISSDLRHHVAQESPLPLIDVSHWASESLWLDVAAKQLSAKIPNEKILVSRVASDPWVFSAGRTK